MVRSGGLPHSAGRCHVTVRFTLMQIFLLNLNRSLCQVVVSTSSTFWLEARRGDVGALRTRLQTDPAHDFRAKDEQVGESILGRATVEQP
jgi:hypothetical protein